MLLKTTKLPKMFAELIFLGRTKLGHEIYFTIDNQLVMN